MFEFELQKPVICYILWCLWRLSLPPVQKKTKIHFGEELYCLGTVSVTISQRNFTWENFPSNLKVEKLKTISAPTTESTHLQFETNLHHLTLSHSKEKTTDQEPSQMLHQWEIGLENSAEETDNDHELCRQVGREFK